MPIYEYECGHCHHRFEVKQGFHDKPQAACPQCQKKAKRVFHPAPIIFKGSGFYVTDHRKKIEPVAGKGEAESGKAKPETKKSKD
jgi:putative FmdB family regulatory protein